MGFLNIYMLKSKYLRFITDSFTRPCTSAMTTILPPVSFASFVLNSGFKFIDTIN
jgi:hypothetical protein